VPRPSDVLAGWGSLLDEISASSRRVRTAKGGHIGCSGGPQPPVGLEMAGSPHGDSGGAAGQDVPRRSSVVVDGQRPSRRTSVEGAVASPARKALIESHARGSSIIPRPTIAEDTAGICSPVLSGKGGTPRLRKASTGFRQTAMSFGAPGSAAAIAAAAAAAARSSGGDAGAAAAAAVAVGAGYVDGGIEEDNVWLSYRIGPEKVPDSVLDTFWRRAVDPKHCQDEVKPLEKVPRLTVTRRELPLAAVHDIEHWRQVNKKRKEQIKAKKEAEHNPSLAEMLNSIFGEHPPVSLQWLDLQDPDRFRAKSARLIQELLRSEEVTDEDDCHQEMTFVLEQEKKHEQELRDRSTRFLGVQEKGRRPAFDEGIQDPYSKQKMREKADRERGKCSVRNARLRRAFEAARTLSNDESGTGAAGEGEELLAKVKNASLHVHNRCQRKVHRMHEGFLRKQAELSDRLQGRVRRLQLDYQEIHDMKVSSILPDAVAGGASSAAGHKPSSGSSSSSSSSNVKRRSQDQRPSVIPGSPSRSGSDAEQENSKPAQRSPPVRGTVLQYLNGHRHTVEKTRQTQHAKYLQQVDKFQGHLRLLADPNRAPERGEVYITECFRHVLATGLVVDTTYFLRVIQNLEPEDLQRIATVNMLAACCDAFGVDLKRYWTFLRENALPQFKPRPCPDQVRSWEEWAPWNGVGLDALSPRDGDADVPMLQEDPLPFGPVVPDEPPTASELVSREDPLADVLDNMVIDSVLCRYGLYGRSHRPAAGLAAVSKVATAAALEWGDDEDHWEAASSARGPSSPPYQPNSSSGLSAASPPGSPQTSQSLPQPPSSVRRGPPMSARVARRNPLSNGAHATLQKTRCLAEPMKDMPSAPERQRPRAPQLAPVVERSNIEPSS